ncbi:YfdX family protein [Marinobacter sp.]|uniref:YfdX family protein n=1 Tax=Marinobacter sp. TaxID=50741 RepID=UPI001B5D52DD|nr:YfdX family protein [Marinobacter sp.]MBQ0834134.1 YfdX family protein [Marinobacter sp.]
MSNEEKTESTSAPAGEGATEVAVAEQKSAMTEAVQPNVDQVVEGSAAEKRKQTTEEAVSALAETKNALAALDEQDASKALNALSEVTGKLELILAQDPQLAFAPVDVQTIVHDVFASTDTIKTLIDDAEYALKHGEVQKARHLLAGLASEVVIKTTSLPLASYPEAIKAVAPLIDQDKTDEAKAALQAVLGTLVVSNSAIIPLPVERARAMLKEAESLAEKSDRAEAEEKRFGAMLKDAKKQLEMAELLGYGRRKKEFEDIYTQIKEVEAKVKSGKSGKGFFDEITASFRSLFDRKGAEKTPETDADKPQGDGGN